MAIYRGPGGAGDATVDATNAAAEVALKTQEAVDAATAAAASAAEAAASAVIASDGLDGIAAYAAAAFGSAADALASETNAADSEANAAISEANAAASAVAAALSEDNAAISEANANEDASTATTKAAEAADSADEAAASAAAALASQNSAASSALDAANSAAAAEGYLPSFTGNNGKYLKTNGTSALWATVDALPTQTGNSGKYLTTNGTAASWVDLSVAPATPTITGTVFGRTDSGVYAPPTALTNGTNGYWFGNPDAYSIYSNLTGDYNGPGAPGDINTAVGNGTIQVGMSLVLVCTRISTGLQEAVNMGVITSIVTGGGGAVTITGTNAINWSLYADSGVWFGYKRIVHQLTIGGLVAENVTLGNNAGTGITTGGENVLLGDSAGNNVGSGRNNVVIGNAATASAQNVSNEVTLGNSSHTKTRLFGALAVGGSSTGTSGQVLTSAGSGSAPTWTNAAGVSSVAMSVPTGLSVSGSPITSSGTLAVTYSSGYSIPLDSKQTNWDTAYGWGNHASAGYLTGITSGQVTGALGFTPENSANKNAANGYAGLDSSGLVPSSILPSYVDDVLEYANLAAFPGTGATGKIYVALDTNKTYRWSGSAYIEISASPGSTDSVTEGSTNLYFTNARARAAVSATGSLSYNSSTGVFSYTQPTNVSTFTNDSGYITSSALSPYLTSATAASTYAPLTGTGTSGTWGISVTGTAANITATSNSTLTTLSALSLPGSQVSGNISGNAANVTGTVAIANGGTGATTAANALTSLGAYPSSNPSGYTSNTGTVTSVGGTGTVSGLTLSGTVTTSGNLTLGGTLSVTPSNFASQTANTFLAAPNGAAGTPTFRALVAADVPTLNQNTTGTAANVTGTVAVANGGTGSTTLTANNVLLGNGTSALQAVAPGTSGNVLTSNGTTWVSSAPAGGGGSSITAGNSSVAVTDTGTNGTIAFTTEGSERARIDASGNMGIGLTNPTQKFEVNGNARIAGSVYLANSSDPGSIAPAIWAPATGTLGFWANSAERARIDSSGRYMVGTTTQANGATGYNARFTSYSTTESAVVVTDSTSATGYFPITVWQTATSGNNLLVGFATEGTLSVRGNIDFNRGSAVIRYNTSSDATLKNIIGDAPRQKSLDILNSTRLREYSWKDDSTNKPQIGVIAQELYETFKGAVSVGGEETINDDDGNEIKRYRPWAVDKTAFTFHLVAGFQHLYEQSQTQQALIEQQAAAITQLTERITALENK